MAPDDFWTRKRKQEQQEEEEARELAEEEKRKQKQTPISKVRGTPVSAQFEDLIKRAPILIDQLEHLYRQYAVGVLARPPIEERSRLDQIVTVLTQSAKSSASDRFRFGGVFQSYSTHKSRWDKLLADVESGKIKRVAGPKKGPQTF